MKIAVKSRNHAAFRREPGIFPAETPPTGAPKHHSRSHFPASGPVTGSFNGSHLKSKFHLAAASQLIE